MEAEGCEECVVHMTKRCQRRYEKASKRLDRRLPATIESELGILRHDPHRGPKLEMNLKGMRSIHIDKFSYRIVYGVDYDACIVTVHKIGHRKSVYDNLQHP